MINKIIRKDCEQVDLILYIISFIIKHTHDQTYIATIVH